VLDDAAAPEMLIAMIPNDESARLPEREPLSAGWSGPFPESGPFDFYLGL
jgi:hypothetical protein